MKKEQFLKELRYSLRKYSNDEVDEAIKYYDEMISDRIEQGHSEEEVIRGLGEIRDITREIQIDLLSNRVNTQNNNLEKTSNSFFMILMLFASPALLPIGIVLFVLFFTVIIVSAALMISFCAATVGLIISLIPSIVVMAQTTPASAVAVAGIILLLIGVFGILTILFFNLTKSILLGITKLATKIARKQTKRR